MKGGRQTKIIELINKYDIETQEELADRLNAAGYNVTQATVSRDIRDLKLTKVSVDGTHQKYIVLQNQESVMFEKYVRVLRDGYLGMEQAQNILVVKTISGMAMAVAAALDSLSISGLVGTIAGDDTVMCAIRTDQEVASVMGRIERMIREA